MKKLLALALCSVSLIASPVLLAQGSNPSPRGASAGDADGPGASDANIGGVSGDEVANKISGGANSNESSGTKGGEGTHHNTAGGARDTETSGPTHAKPSSDQGGSYSSQTHTPKPKLTEKK